MINLYFITASSDVAQFVINNGVDRLFVDLEVLGKDLRQGHLNTVISRHTFDDLLTVRKATPCAEVMVRLNPIYSGTEREVEHALDIGVDVLMLPMFHKTEEVKQFIDLVAGRVRVCLLVETVGAMNCLSEIVKIKGVSEVHIGLNDLHLELGHRFMFEPLACGYVDTMAEVLRNAGIPFGIGGIARIGEGMLPAELILSEHARLGSTAAILSRTFHRGASTVAGIQKEMTFSEEIARLKHSYRRHLNSDPAQLIETQKKVKHIIQEISNAMKS